MISLHQVSKTFINANRKFQAVDSVSLHIESGDIYGIIGSSGAGKSSLLRMINLLERPDAGTVVVNDKDLMLLTDRQLREERRTMGMIFQSFNLVHNRTVSGNVAMPLEMIGIPRKERAERVSEYLDFVGLLDKSDQYPSMLSGGQQQRVAIARALVNSPKVLLCDEPTSSLDPHTTSDILSILKHINQSFGVTIVIVTHEMDVITTLCNKVSMMSEGKLLQTLQTEQGNTISSDEISRVNNGQTWGKLGVNHD
ncbi:methionine ABC transporter ATP-binding protein [Paenibacillus crassostreae]|uniref:ABC transporter domain-containing protein n=1 Tax=Paenibacillus crassostreae TaxID=1763538 RepID=A0A162N7T7_9BACL|nr:ATP-binding cassette domain-containing protein [Paenibacillus crassostreae]AOZ93737.1 hypothetical protein LPB68_17095 [Paenibacillus crassostreae]OAB71272.1 hypothetical protein PNBC_19965 [Paenibacillus crassostreae]